MGSSEWGTSGTVFPPLFSFPQRVPLGSCIGKNRKSRNHPTLGPVIRKLFTDLPKRKKNEAVVNRDEIMGASLAESERWGEELTRQRH